MADAQETNQRRVRRLERLSLKNTVTDANREIEKLWTHSLEPATIAVRIGLLQLPRSSTAARPPLAQLLLPRGVALRLYLLGLFEAQCRLSVGNTWVNNRPLTGEGSWAELIAIDGAYDTKSGTYMRPDTRQRRDLDDLRRRQLQGALRTLEGLDTGQALASVPRGKGNRRRYEEFALLKETGPGEGESPEIYTVPAQRSGMTVTIPQEFFLQGWIQVLHPSEIAVWLLLRALSQWVTGTHRTQGVYLYGRDIEEFGLSRDAWEDACRHLRLFGLIRHAHQGKLDKPVPSTKDLVAEMFAKASRERYEPHRWQILPQGLREDALKVCLKELTLHQQRLDKMAEQRRKSKADIANSESQRQA